MLPSKRVPVPADGNSHLLITLPQGSASYTVVLAVTGAAQVDIGDSTVVAGAGLPIAAGLTVMIACPAGDQIYAAASSATTVAVGASNPMTQ